MNDGSLWEKSTYGLVGLLLGGGVHSATPESVQISGLQLTWLFFCQSETNCDIYENPTRLAE